MGVIENAVDKGAVEESFSAQATTTEATLTPANKRAKEIVAIDAYNKDATNQLLVSLDGGTVFLTVEPLSNLERAGHFQFPRVKGNGGNANYDIVIAHNQ